ncbi:hypothetical protein M406DRAFT_331874 [Cryphonectria parasitica EP155]|uniref:Uncharacterized protein n=1 Tax=Cryphonectria parasitica (strain ATCC 38755 / EP155) TaxID=660469 RepID=A0A9P4XYP9_CRYP1|nr:uncharacterized protein M406DRAFT_331874 [Cryphonectria parasitica EP155]KAF3763349.1 hypothetical protein M406DRAFT_331874 [Cryphonectria parasitica EP155]
MSQPDKRSNTSNEQDKSEVVASPQRSTSTHPAARVASTQSRPPSQQEGNQVPVVPQQPFEGYHRYNIPPHPLGLFDNFLHQPLPQWPAAASFNPNVAGVFNNAPAAFYNAQPGAAHNCPQCVAANPFAMYNAPGVMYHHHHPAAFFTPPVANPGPNPVAHAVVPAPAAAAQDNNNNNISAQSNNNNPGVASGPAQAVQQGGASQRGRRSRRRASGREGRPRPSRWTAQDLTTAREMRQNGQSDNEIAEALGKTAQAVSSKLWRDRGGDPHNNERGMPRRGQT